jgi:hypothetical protein
VNWLCDDRSAAKHIRRERSSTTHYDSPLSALLKDKIQFASRELVDDSRIADGDGY